MKNHFRYGIDSIPRYKSKTDLFHISDDNKQSLIEEIQLTKEIQLREQWWLPTPRQFRYSCPLLKDWLYFLTLAEKLDQPLDSEELLGLIMFRLRQLHVFYKTRDEATFEELPIGIRPMVFDWVSSLCESVGTELRSWLKEKCMLENKRADSSEFQLNMIGCAFMLSAYQLLEYIFWEKVEKAKEALEFSKKPIHEPFPDFISNLVKTFLKTPTL